MTKKIIKVVNDKPNNFTRIEFMVSNVCNYRCWYCSPHAYAGDYRWNKDTNMLIKHFSHLLDFYIANGREVFELNLLGGEPTLWPDLTKFVKSLKEKYNIKVTITTNGSRTLRYWEENCTYFDKLLFSCHPEYVDIDHFINVIDLCFSKGVPVNALIMMDPTNWDKCVSIVNDCNTKSKEKWFISVMEVHSNIQYTREQIEFLKKPTKRMPRLYRLVKDEIVKGIAPFARPKVFFEDGTKKTIERNWISLNNLNYFKGWSCNIGIENINIQKDGLITGTCMEKPFQENVYYNIFDPEFTTKFNPKLIPTICTKEGCFCQPEMLMNKSKV
jgi:MoaA/NifB/PqqE/SkfB family radical SAM enzyme